MSEIPPLDAKLQVLVDAERASDDLAPDAQAVDEVGGRVWATLGLAGVPPAAAAATAAATAATSAKAAGAGAAAAKAVAAGAGASKAAAAASAVGLSLVTKSVIVAAAFGAAALTTYAVVGPRTPMRSAQVVSPPPATTPAAAPQGKKSQVAATGSPSSATAGARTPLASGVTSPSTGAATAAASPAAGSAAGASSSSAASRSRPASHAAAHGSARSAVRAQQRSALPPRVTARRARSTTLGVERTLLERARAALSAGNATVALRRLNEHRRRFRRGELSEERDALTIMALAKLGRVAQAQARARAFRARYPASLLWRAVARALSHVQAAGAK